MSTGGIIAGIVAGVIVVALCAAGFWFYRAWKNEEAKKKNLAGKWGVGNSTGNSTLELYGPNIRPSS
ncbi:hypothetical protein GTA08_BOTSDO02019 [Botryosphaeria dothidea]|uniref:Uncharacterized protein n=1 Tax=Botryosphaeria dothidea TaxID=55169 RepID=A0A8H4J218_9PEZI|nr:hypothetical protein GTA08_BOTSDO02019 [Botryosphaeria dothidea]